MITKIKNLIKRARLCSEDIPSNRRQYGAAFAFAAFFDKVFLCRNHKLYIRALTAYMRKEMRPVTSKYKSGAADTSAEPLRDLGPKDHVWVCWWQGEDAMPPIVKACYNRLKAAVNGDETEIILVTEENVKDYVDIPPELNSKYKQGIISKAHFADYVRYALVKAYGGAWFDATIYISDSLDKRLFEGEYFTKRYSSWKKYPGEPSLGKWSNYYFSACRGSLICSYICDALRYWHSRHDSVPDYVFLDYIIMAAYLDVPRIRELFDAVPINDDSECVLLAHINDPYDEAEFDSILKSCDFSKLTYKYDLKTELEDGRETVYGHIIKDLHP